jgi:hypothetical protein
MVIDLFWQICIWCHQHHEWKSWSKLVVFSYKEELNLKYPYRDCAYAPCWMMIQMNKEQNKPYKLFAALWQVTMNIWVKHVFDLLNISIFVFNRYKIFHQVLVLKIFSIIIFYLYALVNSCMLFPTKKENSCMLFDFVFVVIMFSSTLLKPLLQKLIFFQ